MKTELEIANERILELEEQVKKLTLKECSHLWTKSNTSANTDWWCSRCGKTTNTIGINPNLH